MSHAIVKLSLVGVAIVAAVLVATARMADDPVVPAPRPDGMTPTSQPAKPADRTGSATQPVAKSAAQDRKDASAMKTEKAMFGAGCFWGVEARFRELDGVIATAVGYAGGKTKNPTYKDVCSDSTGHAEVVLVEFDPARVTYDQLLDVFFTSHDPTQVNRQGPDVGEQYRSAVFFYSPEQEAAAKASKEKFEKSGKFKRPIATQIEKAGEFYRAEEYHQQYLEKRGMKSCHVSP